MPAFTDIELINRALGRIGAIEIVSLDDPGPNGLNVVRTWESVRDDLLSKYPWHFTKAYQALSQLTPAPIRGWQFAYQLPSDRIGPPRAYYDSSTDSRPLNRFEIADDTILTDATQVWAFYQRLVPASYWPGYVRELIIVAAAAEYAAQIRENWDLRKQLRREVYGDEQYQGEGGQFKIATDLDAQSIPATQIDGGRNPLISVRWLGSDARGEDWDDEF
jgi:hypothetical protein